MYQKTRFHIFKRDNFRCQYCGKSSPEVVLEVDHVVPVSKGGTNDFDNLITSCRECNRGKQDNEIIPNFYEPNPDKMKKLADEDFELFCEVEEIKKRLKTILKRRQEITILQYEDMIEHEKHRINMLTEESIKQNPDWEGETVQSLKDAFNQNIGIWELQRMQEMSENRVEILIELDKRDIPHKSTFSKR